MTTTLSLPPKCGYSPSTPCPRTESDVGWKHRSSRGGEVGEARDVAEAYYKHFEAGDLDGAAALFGEGCIHGTPSGQQTNEEHRMFGGSFKDAVPDAGMHISTAVESGEDIAIEGQFRGTHSGDLVSPQGTIPASGRTI